MVRTKFATPAVGEYAEYYHQYINKFAPNDFLAGFEAQIEELRNLFGDLPEGEDEKLHAPYTWTLKQLMGHLIDCERVFSTRMLRIAAADDSRLTGFDQDATVANLDYQEVTMSDLLDEFEHLRRANIGLARRLTPESLTIMGTASDNPISAKACLYILAGHIVYHVEIARKRLLQDV